VIRLIAVVTGVAIAGVATSLATRVVSSASNGTPSNASLYAYGEL
jgi:hypothetical protein